MRLYSAGEGVTKGDFAHQPPLALAIRTFAGNWHIRAEKSITPTCYRQRPVWTFLLTTGQGNVERRQG
jgi:hypothetical protein